MWKKPFVRSIFALVLCLLMPSLALAWTPGLKEAAEAVSRGTATAEQTMLVFVHNKEVNLLAQEGKISEYTYAACQDDFFRLNNDFASKAVREAGFDPSISNPKFNPGTDTDVNVLGRGGRKVTLGDIQKINANYQNNVREYFKGLGANPPAGWINTETDFMPHPAHTDPEEFQKIVKYVNQQGGTAYSDPRAAAAQAKLGTTQPIEIHEASAFSATMKNMADAKINKANQLRNEARAIRGSDPGRAEYLEAQARLYDYQAAKYHDRIDQLATHLRDQHRLPRREGQSSFDKAMEHIAQVGRNPFTHKDAATIHGLHQNGLQRSVDHMVDTLLEIAKKDPARTQAITRALAKEVNSLPDNRAGQLLSRIEQAAGGNFAKAVVAETKALNQAARAASKWASFKESVKDLSGFGRVTKLSVVMTAGGALLMAHQGISITLDNVKATDSLWDFLRDCYYHAAWEGTGIGPAFEQAEREEIERYMKEFEAGQSPSMVKHVTFTMLKTGVYMGRDAIIGLLYLPDTIWEYFTQEKEMEGYAAMQNELAGVMRQMIKDRKEFERIMANMRKIGLRDADVKPFLDCLCRNCGGMLGGFYNPGFVTDLGHGPCQCNGPLTIWKTPLPAGNKQVQYDCFNEVARMRYDEAQDIFDKWHRQMLDANAKSVEEELKSIKRDIANKKAMENEDVARGIADSFEQIKELLYPEDVDFVRATVGPYLENHARRDLEAGDIPRAIDNLDRVLNKIGTRHPQQDVTLRQRKAQYQQWDEKWRETKEKLFPDIDTMIGRNQPGRAARAIENLEYRMLKDPSRPLPPALNDPAFLALKARVADLRKRYDQAVKQAWQEAAALEKSRDRRAAIPILERTLNEWEHPAGDADRFRRQIAYDAGEVKRAEEKIALGREAEAAGDLTTAIARYTESLAIQRDDALQATLQELKHRQSKQKQPASDVPTATSAVGPSGWSGGGIQASIPVDGLGTTWDKLSAVGGDFDRFARFEGGGLYVDVPAGHHWGKTGLMAKKPLFRIGATPITVTVSVDPARTTGFAVAFAASQHPDVALINNAWMSWTRNAKGGGDIWIGNVQDAWAGRNQGVAARTSGQAPTPFVFTLQPGRMSLRAGGQAPLSVAIDWLKEGVEIYPHVFSHPAEAGQASSLGLTGFHVGPASAPGAAGKGTAADTSGASDQGHAMETAPDASGRVNLARGKPASQSSTSPWSRPNDAQGAVDGVIDGNFGFHTGNEAHPWWQVDLGGIARIDEVRIYNRLDCCAERARTVQVMLSDDGRRWRTAYRHDGAIFGGKDGNPLKVPLNGAAARYVRLELAEANWLHLDEVEVYGRMTDLPQAAPLGQTTGPAGGKAYPVHGLGDLWEPLSAVGGDFQRFARFEADGLVVDVPAGNYWGKTGIMAKRPMFTLGKTPVSVTVSIDPERTTGFVVAFAAAKHPDVALIDNAWMSWARRDDGSAGELWIGNVQDAWAGRDMGRSAVTAARAPTHFVLTLEPGKMSLQANGQTLGVAIGWLKEGVAIHPHLFASPPSEGKAAKFALKGLHIQVGNAQAHAGGSSGSSDGRPYPPDQAPGAAPGGRDYTGTSTQAGQLIFEVGNIGGTLNGPSKATRFTLESPHMITLIRDYHWNSGRGAQPGTIALQGADGRIWGPWQTTGAPGQGGVPNAYWRATPNVVLPAGTYTVVDSDPASWSHNAQSGNRGFVRVEGYPSGSPPTPGAGSLPATGNAAEDAVQEMDGLIDAVKALKGLFGK